MGGEDTTGVPTEPSRGEIEELAVGTALGDANIVRKLGHGAQGDVYEVVTNQGARQAFKVLSSTDSELIARLAREATTASAIHHPHVTRIHGLERTANGRAFIRMELLRGEPLSEYLRREAPLEVEVACTLIKQIAEGLGAAHELGVIHRDVKPQNIFISDSPDGPIAKVMDFGIAKASKRWDLTSITSTGKLIGTPAYMSPEQIMLPDELDHRTDIYSMGLVLYEMLVGRRPFSATEVGQLLMLHVKANPTPPHQVDRRIPLGVSDAVMRCLAKRPESRFSTMRAFVERLERVLVDPSLVSDHQPVALTRTSTFEGTPVEMPPMEPPYKVRSWPLLLAGLLLVGVLAAGLLAFRLDAPVVAPIAEVPSKVIDEPPPRTPPAPTPTRPASVTVASRPPGAVLFLGNVAMGQTPKSIDLAPNVVHSLTVRLDGYEDGRLDVSLQPGEDARRTVVLTAVVKRPAAEAPALKPRPKRDARRIYTRLDRRLALALDKRGLNRNDLVWIVEDVGSDWVMWRHGLDGVSAEQVEFSYEVLSSEVTNVVIDKGILRDKLRRVVKALRKAGGSRVLEERYILLRERTESASRRSTLERLAHEINRLETEVTRRATTR